MFNSKNNNQNIYNIGSSKLNDDDMAKIYNGLMKNQISYTDIGKKYGVSLNSIKKHIARYCKNHNLDMPNKKKSNVIIYCSYCSKKIERQNNQLKRSIYGVYFCCKKCHDLYKSEVALFDPRRKKFDYFNEKDEVEPVKRNKNYGYSGKFEYKLNVGDIYKNKNNDGYREIISISSDGLKIKWTNGIDDYNSDRKTFINKVNIAYNEKYGTINPRNKHKRGK